MTRRKGRAWILFIGQEIGCPVCSFFGSSVRIHALGVWLTFFIWKWLRYFHSVCRCLDENHDDFFGIGGRNPERTRGVQPRAHHSVPCRIHPPFHSIQISCPTLRNTRASSQSSKNSIVWFNFFLRSPVVPSSPPEPATSSSLSLSHTLPHNNPSRSVDGDAIRYIKRK
jgi:hypothetical protein